MILMLILFLSYTYTSTCGWSDVTIFNHSTIPFFLIVFVRTVLARHAAVLMNNASKTARVWRTCIAFLINNCWICNCTPTTCVCVSRWPSTRTPNNFNGRKKRIFKSVRESNGFFDLAKFVRLSDGGVC